jgi:O-antigen/teichoic acid export membrane protein
MEGKVAPAEDITQRALARVARGGTLIFAAMIAGRFLGFLRQLTAIRLLSPRDYGLFALGMTVIGVFEILGTLGLELGSQRYIAYFRGKGEDARVRGVITSTNRMLTVSIGLVTLLCLLLAGPLSELFGKPEMREVLIWLAPIIPCTVLLDTTSSYFLALQDVRMKVYFQNLGLYLVSLACVFILVAWYRGLDSLLLAMTLSYELVSAAALASWMGRFPASLRHGPREPMARKLLAFSLPLFVLGAFNYLIMQTDTLMLGYFVKADLVGIYNAAFLLVGVLEVFHAAVSTIYMPVASDLVARRNLEEMAQLYRSVTKWMYISTFPAFLIIFLYPSQVLGALFGGAYPEAARALQLLSLGVLAGTLMGPNGMTLLALGRPRVIMVSGGAATAANIALNALLIPHWGMSGAALASCLSLLVLNLLNSAYLYRAFHIQPFRRDYVIPVLLLAACAAALYLPLLALADLSGWLTPLFYPLFLGLGLAILKLSGSVNRTDARFIQALKRKVSGK